MKTLLLSIFSFMLMSCSSTVQVENDFTPVHDENLIELGVTGAFYDVHLRFFDENDNLLKIEQLGDIKIGEKSEKVKPPKKASYYRIWFAKVDEETTFGAWVKEFDTDNYSSYTIEHSPIESGNNLFVLNGKTNVR